jgi:Tfp pilus assembly protein PilN
MIRVNLLEEVLSPKGSGKPGERHFDLPEAPGEAAGQGQGFPFVGLTVAMSLGSMAFVHALLLQSVLTQASAKKVQLERERKQYDPYISLEKKFRERKDALQKKEEVMTALKRQQALPVHLMEELANSLPSDVWFKKLIQKGNLITIEGEGRNFESINAFFGALQTRERWFRKLSYPGAKRSPNGSFEFTISFELQNAG